jgi:hypothetical protein
MSRQLRINRLLGMSLSMHCCYDDPAATDEPLLRINRLLGMSLSMSSLLLRINRLPPMTGATEAGCTDEPRHR